MIIQGVTPKIVLNCKNFNPKEMAKIEITMKNDGQTIKKNHDNLELQNDKIIFFLTQCETLMLNPRKKLYIQVRVDTGKKIGVEEMNEIKASLILETDVKEFLGREVL